MTNVFVTSPCPGARARALTGVEAHIPMTVDEDDGDIQSTMAVRLELIQEDKRRRRKMKCCMIIMMCCFIWLGWSGGVLGAWILRAIEGNGNQVPTIERTEVSHRSDLPTPTTPTNPTTLSVSNNVANNTVDALPTEKIVPTIPIVPDNLTTPIVSNYPANTTTDVLARRKGI